MRRSDLYDTEGSQPGDQRWSRTGRRTTSDSDDRQQSYVTDDSDRPWDDLDQDEEQSSSNGLYSSMISWLAPATERAAGDIIDGDDDDNDEDEEFEYSDRFGSSNSSGLGRFRTPAAILTAVAAGGGAATYTTTSKSSSSEMEADIVRPDFVFEHPYISSSYYTSTKSLKTLESVDKFQVQPKKMQLAGKKVEGEKDFTRDTQTRLAILRPFCAFDAGPLPTTFDCEFALGASLSIWLHSNLCEEV